MPAWLRWILAMIGAGAVTGGLFVAMPSMIRISNPLDFIPRTFVEACGQRYWTDGSIPVCFSSARIFVGPECMCVTYYPVRLTPPRFDFEPWDGRTIDPLPELDLPPAWDTYSLRTPVSVLPPDIRFDWHSAGHTYPADPCFWPLEYPTQSGFREEGEVRIVYDRNGEGEMINPRVVWYSHPAFLRAVERVLARCPTGGDAAQTGHEMTLVFELED